MVGTGDNMLIVLQELTVYLIGDPCKKIRSPTRMWYFWDALRKQTNFLAG